MRPIPVLLLAVSGVASACGRPEAVVDVARAQAHVEALAGRIGSRPTGSAANVRAREYVAGELTRMGFAVRLQEADAVDAARGFTAHVVNIIAARDGASQDAIALVSHYDSVADGPGAADDALGVAVCLESARELVSAPARHSLFVIATDGEELGLMGARAAVADRVVAARVKSVLNFDGTGAAGPALMFQSGPGWAAPFDAWASSAVSPRGASFGVEIYRRLPNDTDFTVFQASGAAGVNFAPIGDSYAYHTDRDVPARVDAGVLRQEIANTVATVRALDVSTFVPRPQSPVYFEVLGQRVVVMSPAASAVLSWAAAAIGCFVWALIGFSLWRERRAAGLILAGVWSVLMAAAAAGAMVAAAALLRAATSERQPWYASPGRCLLFLAAAGCLGGWIVTYISVSVPPRVRPSHTPSSVWWAALPLWIALTIGAQLAAGSAAYLFSLPLAAAGVLLTLARRSPPLTHAASGLIAVVVAILWTADLRLLISFVVSLFGWLGVVPPVWLLPALLALGALVFVPPLAAVMAGSLSSARRSTRIGLALAAVVAGSAALAAWSPAYTTDRPEMRAARYVQDDISGQAWWEVGGNEARVDLDAGGPEDVAWQPAATAPPATVRVGSLGSPFVFRSPAGGARSEAPASVRSSASTAADGRLRLDISIVPREPVVVRVVLPPGLRPDASSIAGVVSGDRWTATYAAPAPAGLDARFEFAGRAAAELQQTVVVLIAHGLPGAANATGRPSWLSTAQAAWRTRSYFIVPAAPGTSR